VYIVPSDQYVARPIQSYNNVTLEKLLCNCREALFGPASKLIGELFLRVQYDGVEAGRINPYTVYSEIDEIGLVCVNN
jgi:hypothetical protein